MGRLNGKVAVVSGAAQGIGYATAHDMAREGAVVWAIDRDPAGMKKFANVSGVRFAQLDVTNATGIVELAKSIERVDILFNCAGYVHAGTILDCSEEAWDMTMNINVKSMFFMIKEFLPKMIQNRSGSIINMSSIASSLKGVTNRFSYSSSKAAVIGLTKSVAADYIGYGVRSNAICPGIIDTPSLRDRMNAMPDPEAAIKAFISRQPTGRLGLAEEISPLVVYLGSDESSFVTGAVYSIDGGITL